MTVPWYVGRCNFAALVLKGVIEHGHTGAYFASFGALDYHVAAAVSCGWLITTNDGEASVTPAGQQHYESSGLKMVGRTDPETAPTEYGFPGGERGYLMDWSHYNGEEVR